MLLVHGVICQQSFIFKRDASVMETLNLSNVIEINHNEQRSKCIRSVL